MSSERRQRWGRITSESASTQAERVIAAFGGVRALVKALAAVGYRTAVSSVYSWVQAKQRGDAAGLVPAHVIPAIVRAAVAEGVYLGDVGLPRELL